VKSQATKQVRPARLVSRLMERLGAWNCHGKLGFVRGSERRLRLHKDTQTGTLASLNTGSSTTNAFVRGSKQRLLASPYNLPGSSCWSAQLCFTFAASTHATSCYYCQSSNRPGLIHHWAVGKSSENWNGAAFSEERRPLLCVPSPSCGNLPNQPPTRSC